MDTSKSRFVCADRGPLIEDDESEFNETEIVTHFRHVVFLNATLLLIGSFSKARCCHPSSCYSKETL